MAISRELHRSIAQEADPHSRNFAAAEEEHLDHGHMVEPGHNHTQVAGVGKHLAEDTVQLAEPENPAATGLVVHTFVAPDRD